MLCVYQLAVLAVCVCGGGGGTADEKSNSPVLHVAWGCSGFK